MGLQPAHAAKETNDGLDETLLPHVTEAWSKVAGFAPTLASAVRVLLIGWLAALAFGLGSRDVAGALVRDWLAANRK